MKRKLLYLTTIILTLAGCSSEDYVGNEQLHEVNENGRPVTFNLISAPQTRAAEGALAAGYLNNNFVVWGEKTMSDNSVQTVFNNYQANYTSNSDNTTTTNSSGWEYVGYKNLPNGVSVPETGDSPGAVDIPTYANSSANSSGIEQSIKYWDFSADKYNFFAYSLGEGVEVTPATTPQKYTFAKASKMEKGTFTYSLEGTKDQLSTCYISNLVDMAPANQPVQLIFRNMMSKVRVAFYETIPGYSITKADLKFYSDKNQTEADITDLKPSLYDNGTTASIPNGGKYTITFNATTGNPELSLETGFTTVGKVEFGALKDESFDIREYKEDNAEEGSEPKNYLGRYSNTATKTDEVYVLPNPDGTALTMKMDYTLLSRDGYGETIHVKGATATIPAQYAAWKPNYTYTYIFKISDNTDALIGGVAGLYPITLDAVVNTNPDGKQETITTVTDPKSITTYQYGSYVAGTDEYYASSYQVEESHTSGPIYVVVNDKTDGLETLKTTGDGVNVKLYTATVETGAAQGITETTVANVLKVGTYDSSAKTWTVTDVNSKALVVTALEASALTLTNEIAAVDSPDGKAVVFYVDEGNAGIYKAVKFAPTAGTNYIIEYTDTSVVPNVSYYKVIKVKE